MIDMARLPNCMSCKKCYFPRLKCEIYKDGIPHDIAVELAECKHYELKKHEFTKEELELPLAKGR